MSEKKTKRWTWRCGNEDHPGVFAPSRLAKDDLRRYCIPCSEKRGKLVEREMLARETRQEKRRQRQREERVRRRSLERRVHLARHLEVWRTMYGKTAAEAIARGVGLEIRLRYKDDRLGPILFSDLEAYSTVPVWQLQLEVLNRIAMRAHRLNPACPAREGLLAAARASWTEVDAAARDILVRWRLGDERLKEAPAHTASMHKAIAPVLEAAFSTPAEDGA